MRALLLVFGLAAFAPAQENASMPPSAEGFTIYQTVVIYQPNQGPAAAEQAQHLAERIKKEYSRHPDGREVLAEAGPAMLKESGHPLHSRLIWDPNGVMTRVIMPWKNLDTVVEPGNERLSGHAKPGSPTCEPEQMFAGLTYVGNESLQGLDTYRWRLEAPTNPNSPRIDTWYWKQADCLPIQVERLGRNADGSLNGGYSNVQFDRMVPHADFDLFVIPSDFEEGSSLVAAEKRMGKKTMECFWNSKPSLPERYCRAAVAPPDNYEANHAEALRRRGLKVDDK